MSVYTHASVCMRVCGCEGERESERERERDTRLRQAVYTHTHTHTHTSTQAWLGQAVASGSFNSSVDDTIKDNFLRACVNVEHNKRRFQVCPKPYLNPN